MMVRSLSWGIILVLLVLIWPSAYGVSQEVNKYEHFLKNSNNSQDIVILNHGLAAFEERLQMVERAQKSIDVEYYIYRTDKSGKMLTQALVKKARTGVKVRMLLDYYGSASDVTPFHAHELASAGIEVKYFNVVTIFDLVSGQHRNHRKLLIIDGNEITAEAIAGGRNVGDEYYDLHKEYNFLDRDIYVKGEIVNSMQKTFDIIFTSPLSRHLAREKMPELKSINSYDFFRYESESGIWQGKVQAAKDFINTALDQNLEEIIRKKGQKELSLQYRGNCDQISFMSEYPAFGKNDRRILKGEFFRKMREAKESITIDSAYVVINNELGDALDKAFSNKVKIKLLTNSINSIDSISVYSVFDSTANHWIKKGMASYIFRGEKPTNYSVLNNISGNARFGVHAKTYIFDQKDVVIGSSNADPRSANYNLEMVVVCKDNPDVAAVVSENIELRMQDSIHLDSKKSIKNARSYQIGFFKILVYYFSKIPANYLSHLM